MSCVLLLLLLLNLLLRVIVSRSHDLGQFLRWYWESCCIAAGVLIKMQVVITVFLVALVFPMCLVACTGFFGCHFITALAVYAQALDPASPYPLQDFSIIIRPHRSTTYVDAAYCYRPSSMVCLSVCHTSEPCKNSCTDRDAIWVEDSGGPKEPCVRWRSRSPHGKGQFLGGGHPIVKYRDALWSSAQKRLN